MTQIKSAVEPICGKSQMMQYSSCSEFIKQNHYADLVEQKIKNASKVKHKIENDIFEHTNKAQIHTEK